MFVVVVFISSDMQQEAAIGSDSLPILADRALCFFPLISRSGGSAHLYHDTSVLQCFQERHLIHSRPPVLQCSGRTVRKQLLLLLHPDHHTVCGPENILAMAHPSASELGKVRATEGRWYLTHYQCFHTGSSPLYPPSLVFPYFES